MNIVFALTLTLLSCALYTTAAPIPLMDAGGMASMMDPMSMCTQIISSFTNMASMFTSMTNIFQPMMSLVNSGNPFGQMAGLATGFGSAAGTFGSLLGQASSINAMLTSGADLSALPVDAAQQMAGSLGSISSSMDMMQPFMTTLQPFMSACGFLTPFTSMFKSVMDMYVGMLEPFKMIPGFSMCLAPMEQVIASFEAMIGILGG